MKITDLLSLIEKVPIGNDARMSFLANPEPFLKLLQVAAGKRIAVDEFLVLQPWAIAALACLGRKDQYNGIYLENLKTSLPSKFAFSMGLDDVIEGDKVHGQPEEGRTVKLHCVSDFADVEPVSDEIAALIVSDASGSDADEYLDAEEVRKTIRYVMIELLRNVVQHSEDKRGGIILAQRMDKGQKYEQPVIQVAVVDSGVGILETLRATHPDIDSPVVALERSFWPYYSGKFHSFQRGSAQNAGLGLFFVSEMAKLTSGRVLISSRGASLLLQGDPEALGNNKIEILPTGYEGTLVAFEMPKRGVADYDQLIKRIVEIARERTVKRETHHWIRFDIPPKESMEFMISIASENTVKAEEFSTKELIPRIKAGQVLVLNFTQMKICTQSYMHALLFQAAKTAFELKVPMFAKGASPSVRDGIYLVEMYAL